MMHANSLLLISFRKYKDWDQSYIASRLNMDLEEYKALESGESELNGSIVEKLAELYDIPTDCFSADRPVVFKQADVLFTHCTFSGNNGAGYINHQYNDRGIDLILSSKNDEIKSLKEQIADLREKNNKLIALLSRKLNN